MAEHNTTFEVSSMTQLNGNNNIKALANVVINGKIAVNGIKVMQSEKGLFVAMPSKKVGGEFTAAISFSVRLILCKAELTS